MIDIRDALTDAIALMEQLETPEWNHTRRTLFGKIGASQDEMIAARVRLEEALVEYGGRKP